MAIEYSALRNYQKGDVIIREGDISDDVYIIKKGKAKVVRHDEAGNEVVVDIIDSGKVFGELGFILEQPRNSTIIALTDIEVEEINPRVFSELYDLEYARLIRPVLQTMAERLRFADARISELQQKDKVFYAEKGVGSDKRFSITLRALTRKAVSALEGKGSVEIDSFPLLVGRYSRRRSDDMFHANTLSLLDDPPYTISRSHFGVIQHQNDLYFVDRGGTLGSWVNGEQVGGDPQAARKKVLKYGENTIVLGDKSSKLKFSITTHID